MKKKFCSLALLATAGVGSMFMSACGDPALESISVKDGSIETTLLVGSTPDWSDLVLNLNYENDETATATKNADMQISEIDTNALGEQELVIKYKGLTTKVKIYIVAHEGDLYEYIGYQKPDSYVLYEGNTRDASTTVDTEFMIGSHRYKVGDDNPFKFLPKITAINQNDQTVTVTEYTSDVVVKENGVELTGDDLKAVVTIDNAHSTFDFTEAAVGRTFEITVKPLNYDEDMPYDPITFSVDVVNAWNVYNVADLSRVESNAQTAGLWADKKAATGIDTTTEIEGVVLHSDLEIKKSDLPDTMFHPANTVQGGVPIGGTLKDGMSFFTRDIDANDTFTIYGNYFTIKTCNEGNDAIPLVEYLDYDGKFGHAAVFSFGGDNYGHPEDPQGNVVIKDLSMKGNGSREGALDENEEPVNHKALIGIITSAQNTTIDNCLTRAFTSHVISLGDYDYVGAENIACNINNSKLIDSFQSLMLAWGSRNNNINNSVMKESGGPLIVSTHVDAKNTHQYANITVNNSVMESIVMGNEAWFDKNGARSIISLFKAMNELIKGFSTAAISQNIGVDKVASFENALNQYNFFAVNMEDDNIFNTEVIESKTTIKDADGNVISQQDMNNAIMSALCNAGYVSGSVGGLGKDENGAEIENAAAAPVFECGGSFVTIDLPKAIEESGDPMKGLSIIIADEAVADAAGSALVPISLDSWETHALCKNPALKAIIGQRIANFFNGDYVNVYLGGQCLGCTFQMFHLDPQA